MSNLTLTQKTLKDGNGSTFSGEVGQDGGSNIYSLTVPLDQTGALLPQAAGTSGSNALPVQGVSGGVALPVSAASLPLPPGAAQDGTDATGVTQLAGGVGIRGWLSGIFSKLSGTLSVSWSGQSVTANAGTNLNTSALALESGGNLATVASGVLAQGSATSGQKGSLEMGAVSNSAPAYTIGQTSPLSLNTTGGLRVDGSGVTQPISAASLPLPSGAATAANQPAINADGGSLAHVTNFPATQPVSGTVTANAGSGTFGTNVSQIGGASVSTAASGVQKVGITGNAGAAVDAAGQNTASPSNEIIVGGQFNTTPATITSGNVSPLQLDSSGNLKVNVAAGGAAGGTSSNFSATFPSAGTAIGAKYLSSPPTLTSGQMVALQTDLSGNLKVNVAAGGASGGTSSSFGIAFPGVGTATGLQYLSSAPTLTSGNMAAFQGDVNGNLKVNLQTALPAGANLIGSANLQCSTSGGASTYAALGGTGNALLTTTAVAVKSTAGTLYRVRGYNPNSSIAYIQLFDLAPGSVTLGTTVPKDAVPLLPNAGFDDLMTGDFGTSYLTAIAAAVTTTATGNVAASLGVTATFYFK